MTAFDELQHIELLVSWRGGPGIDVVSIVHNGTRVPTERRRQSAERSIVRVEYDVRRAVRHDIHGVFSFIGDTRTQLELHCMIGGVLAGGPIQTARAEHRWEVRGGWSPFSRRA